MSLFLLNCLFLKKEEERNCILFVLQMKTWLLSLHCLFEVLVAFFHLKLSLSEQYSCTSGP